MLHARPINEFTCNATLTLAEVILYALEVPPAAHQVYEVLRPRSLSSRISLIISS